MEDVNTEIHAEVHEETHHEEIEHHEPTFKVKVLTFVWTIIIAYVLFDVIALINDHVFHELIHNILEAIG